MVQIKSKLWSQYIKRIDRKFLPLKIANFLFPDQQEILEEVAYIKCLLTYMEAKDFKDFLFKADVKNEKESELVALSLWDFFNELTQDELSDLIQDSVHLLDNYQILPNNKKSKK